MYLDHFKGDPWDYYNVPFVRYPTILVEHIAHSFKCKYTTLLYGNFTDTIFKIQLVKY